MNCKNCNHKIVATPPLYVGEEKYFHVHKKNSAPYCLNPKCMCDKAEPIE